MGEIGIDRKEYLHELSYCDILLISRGYQRRSRQMWGSARWSTYHQMLASAGTKAMREAGIYSQTDLIKFPWEQDAPPPLSAEEEAEMQREIAMFNQRHRKE